MIAKSKKNFRSSIRVALLVNIVAPYRVKIYRTLAEHFDVGVFVSGIEKNRSTWRGVENELEGLTVKRVWGITLAIPRRHRDGLFDRWYLHLNPGYLQDLIRFAPDAIISNEMGFRSLMALLYGFLFRKPVWVWWGGTLHTERNIGIVKRVLRKLFARLVPRWISYGSTSTEYLFSLGIPNDKILQIQNCVDENIFKNHSLPAFSLTPRPVLLYAGQLIGRKGVDLLLESAARLQKKGLIFTLVLVGSGPEKERLEAKAYSLGLHNVHFFPPRRPEEMPAVYRSADVLVFPTLEDVWGLVVNEAMLSGLPVISSIYAGCTSEIVPPENTFDPLIPESFDSAMERAVTGKIAPPDISKIIPCEVVANMIAEDIRRHVSK